ncbi:DUF3048 domain-containing protein [Natronincola ferrireducens]|uniref:DUF3048 domain-containing protein n=1 Tax=Natronincola ferrireducens TaxID=393762 RepID=A0A1G9BGQ5_9FIRM|nr:DUF3048 domain-containing protein [Natronincola ferrireducens]SDK38390.1 Protein of unknown function [Natronincola ferrireducens]
MHWRRIVIGILAIGLIGTMLACSKKPEIDEEPIEEVVIELEEEKESFEGMAINPLTGLWIDKEAAIRRPVAVMINNMKAALPQSGISQADIMYETLAEGNITRLVAVFQDFNAEKIGPIRSTRHYYLNFAFDHDAVFVHHGGSPQAFQAIKNLKPANLNTLSYLEGIMAWRDPVRSKQRGMFEHSLYTNTEGIMKGWEAVGYRKEVKEGLERKLNFMEEEWTPEGEKADIVIIPFSKDYTGSFQYNPETKLYKRYQSEQPHIDENNNQQLETKNIIIQYADIRVISGDAEGRREIELIGSGKGLYISNGKAMPIVWKKSTYDTATQFQDINGNPLKLNKGKTWIAIFPQNREIQLQ